MKDAELQQLLLHWGSQPRLGIGGLVMLQLLDDISDIIPSGCS